MADTGEQRYYHGDEVRMSLALSQDGNPVAVDVVYINTDNPSFTFTLSGNPELDEGSPTAGPGKRSTVLVSGVLDASQEPGFYMADRVTVHSFVGFSAPATVSAHPGLPVLSVLADPGETFVKA